MENQMVKHWLRKASKNLSLAERELERPREDVMAMAVCFFAKESLSYLLKSYLVIKAHKPKKVNDLDGMIDQCLSLDQHFNSYNWQVLSCGKRDIDNTEVYCMNLPKIRECFALANDVKSLVFWKLNIDEKAL